MSFEKQLDRTAQDYAFMWDAWAVIAAVAWDGFQEHGPGVVLIAWSDGAPELRYADVATLDAADHIAHVADLLEHLAAYDPEREVLIVVRRAEGLRGYRLHAAELAPPAASALAHQVARPPTA
jgi:hypothetical protein